MNENPEKSERKLSSDSFSTLPHNISLFQKLQNKSSSSQSEMCFSSHCNTPGGKEGSEQICQEPNNQRKSQHFLCSFPLAFWLFPCLAQIFSCTLSAHLLFHFSHSLNPFFGFHLSRVFSKLSPLLKPTVLMEFGTMFWISFKILENELVNNSRSFSGFCLVRFINSKL